MIAYHTKDERYHLLRDFKNTLVGMANNHSLRSVIRRNGTDGAGPFLVKIRKRLFGDLMKIQQQAGWQLITEPEIIEIRRHWEKDKDIHSVGDKRRPLLWNLSDIRDDAEQLQSSR